MAVITYPLDGIDFFAEQAQTYFCPRTSGVYSAEDNFPASVTGQRTITLGTGLLWMRNKKFAGFSVNLTEPLELTVPISDPNFPKVARIICRFSKLANKSEFLIVDGVAASEPKAPGVTQTEDVYELGLYTVTIPQASTAVKQEDIKNTMLDETVCGLMRDGVTKIPTNQLYQNAEALLGKIKFDAEKQLAKLQGAVDKIAAGNDVMLQTAFNPSGKTGQVAFEADNNSYTLFLAWTDESVGIKQVIGVRQAHGDFDYNEMLKNIFEKGKVPTIIARKIKDINGDGKIDSSDIYIAMRWCSNLEPENNFTTEQIFKVPDSFNTAILTFVTWGSGSGNMKFEGHTNLTGKMTVFLREDGKHTISIDGK